MDEIIVLDESQKINALLTNLEKGELIEKKDYSIGVGNRTNGYTWIDTEQILVALTKKGKDAIDLENSKGETARLMESTILTNQSVRETNTANIRNLHFQKNAQILTIVLGGLSTLFIFITVAQAYYDTTSQELRDMKKIMQSQSQKTQKLDSSLQEIKTSIETKQIDTVFVRLK